MAFYSLLQRLQKSLLFNCKRFDRDQWLFILYYLLINERDRLTFKKYLIVTSSMEEASSVYEKLKGKLPTYNCYFFPEIEQSLYTAVLPSEKNLFQRFAAYQSLCLGDGPNLIITTAKSLLLKGPSAPFFREHSLEIKSQETFPPEELISQLINLGYTRSSLVERVGTFAKRGEILDIYPINGQPVRLHYFDEIIENIFPIDLNGQKTLRHQKIEQLRIGPSPYIFFNNKFHHHIIKHFPRPSFQFQKKYAHRKNLLASLKNNDIFEEFPYCPALFVDQPENFLSYFSPADTLINLLEPLENLEQFFSQLVTEYETVCFDQKNDCILPHPKAFFNSPGELLLKNFRTITLSQKEEYDRHPVYSAQDLRRKLQDVRSLFYTFSQRDSVGRFKDFIDFDGLLEWEQRKIAFFQFNLERGFFWEEDNMLVVSDTELFGSKQTVRKREKRYRAGNDNIFIEQFSQLKKGDWVIHAHHGIGRYLGLKKIEREGGGDFLAIEYRDEDKVYVPIYSLKLVQKHADATMEKTPDSLRSKKFSLVKSKARRAAKELAFDLLKLQAERQVKKAFAFTPPNEDFQKFEDSFPFIETADQISAVDDILEDMQKDTPMDRLICGDVGFGKTEVAMRAAYKAVLDHKQVAVIVPTTILALQHYHSFSTRFADIPVNISVLSRLQTQKESKQIVSKLQMGGTDILIGTHRVFSSDVKFLDLGLVIVDEEHRFGVAHKEQLKYLKPDVDFLALTATPIPRTLQLSLLSIRDISLISTPPPRRKAITTFVVKENDIFMKKVIRDELARGGQVLIVYNRVQTIEIYRSKVKDLVPEGMPTFIHGQLPEKEIQKIMNDFYNKKYNILIATTIIESGLDIPIANTMIIERADTYGLSQLYQLRGRIGRSERKAYCYFVIPRDQLTSAATKRLNALMSYDGLGLGFHLANVDLDIRGAGDILGSGQSGHIASVGLELYQELLKEAIDEIKGETSVIGHVEIKTPFQAFIPESYMNDSSLRLKYYKKISLCLSSQILDSICEEIEDMFGRLPKELINLITILKIKLALAPLGVSSLTATDKSIVLKLDKNALSKMTDRRDLLINYFSGQPQKYRFMPDDRVSFSPRERLNLDVLLRFATELNRSVQVRPTEYSKN